MSSSDHQQQQQLQQQQHDAFDQSSQPDNQYQFQQEPTPVHAPGVPIPPQPANSAATSQTQQLNPVQGTSVSGSLNPAAVAVVAGALAQLTHYAGSADGAQTAMYEQIGPSQFRGRGSRGGRPFRGGGRGHFNHRGRAPYRGRGRGRYGAGRHFISHSSGPAISNEASASAVPTLGIQPSSLVSEQIPSPAPTQMPAAPSQPPLLKPWCEICKVECNSKDIMEQHMNGKRHKKNLLVHEELQRLKAINGQQDEQISTSQLSSLTTQPEKVLESEKKEIPAENTGSETTADNPNDETELQNNVGETSEVRSEEPQGEPSDNSAVRGCGFKRKMRGGKRGKYMRTNDGSRKPVEPTKPKQAVSFICELCNVKCESQVVYNSHLTGKKHLSSLKRVHGSQALYGEAGLQAFHPPNNDMSNSLNSQYQQGISDPQVLLTQLLMTVLSQVQVQATAPPSGSMAAQIQAPIPVAGSSHEHLQNLSETQVSESTTHVEGENLTGETKSQLISAPPELDGTAGSSTNAQNAGGKSATEEKVLQLPQDSSVMMPADNPVAANN